MIIDDFDCNIILIGLELELEGVAVGCGWQAFVAYVNVGCYYVVGIPLGCLLGFHFNLGVKVYINYIYIYIVADVCIN